MELEEYINEKKEQYQIFLDFIESETEIQYYFNVLYNYLEDQEILENKEDLELFLRLISKVLNNHHRTSDFPNKIELLLTNLSNIIKRTFSNIEIFNFFKSNKLLLYYSIKKNLINFDDEIGSLILQSGYVNYSKYSSYRYFFYPEISRFFDSRRKQKLEDELLEFDQNILLNFEENCKIGENHSHICTLIRNDSIEDFISFVNQTNFPLNGLIKTSIFETNPFLISKQEVNLIEYACFFGSIQIIKYLTLNKVKLQPSSWIYAIHSDNADLIHFLEENHVKPEDNTYQKYLEESIKCHHNNFALYFLNNLITHSNNMEIEYALHYYNFTFFPNDPTSALLFSNACKYNYLIIIKLLLKSVPDMKIEKKCFKDCMKLKQIEIPNGVISIEESAFYKCTSLSQVKIPSSVKSIGPYSFFECSSLVQINIPDSVTYIGSYSFKGCALLNEISIPNSVISIEPFTFCGCESLRKVIIPPSVNTLKTSAFCECHLLNNIKIPSSVSEIGDSVFCGCISLNSIEIPSSVKEIGSYAFNRCSSLKQIKVPLSVQKVGFRAFGSCSSLKEIIIPDLYNTDSLGISDYVKVIRISK